MPVTEMEQVLSDAAAEVLETMFFTSLAEEGEPVPPITGPLVCPNLSFRGPCSGRLGLRIPLETGRQIAANFLGLEGSEVTQSQLQDVLCELSNMICGSVLSRLESGSIFELLHPEIGPGETAGSPAVSRTLALEDGVLEVWFQWEAAP